MDTTTTTTTTSLNITDNNLPLPPVKKTLLHSLSTNNPSPAT